MIASRQEIRKKPQHGGMTMFCPIDGAKIAAVDWGRTPRAIHAAWSIARGTMRIVLVNMLVFIFILLAFSGVWLPKLTGGIN